MSAPSLVDDKRGAVLVEFVVAVFPMLTIFFVFLQLATIAVATLMVKESAIVGARAAAVMSNEHENVPERCKDKGKDDIEKAVRAGLGTWAPRIATQVEVTDGSSRAEYDGPYDLVTVVVTATYRCEVPLGRVICRNGTKTIVETKSMPHQGARYKKTGCSGGRSGGATGDWGGADEGDKPWTGGGGSFGGGGASGDFSQ